MLTDRVPLPSKRSAIVGYRIFIDTAGTEWQAWDVIPKLADRRALERRKTRQAVERERRRRVDRRLLAGKRPMLHKGLDSGWLCFEAPFEKRRLAPIPGDWLRVAVARLEEYLWKAKPAPRVSGAIETPVIANMDRRTG